MARPTPEAMLLSALVNSQEVLTATAYGITPEMMHGYQAEYRWAMNYRGTFGKSPTAEGLTHKFPGFPLTDHQDVQFLAEEVVRKHTKRQQVALVKEAATLLQEDDVETVSGLLMGYMPTTLRSPMENALLNRSFLDDYAPRADGFQLPWPTAQGCTGGLRPGDLMYIAMRLGQGKSWYLAACVALWLMQGKTVLFYSMEMPAEQILIRVHVLLGRMLGFDVDHVAMRDRVFNRGAYLRIMDGIQDKVTGTLYIQDSGKVTPARIAGTVAEADVTVVDYVGLMYSDQNKPAIDDWRVQASISNGLKAAALDHNTRLLVASQINREGDSEGKRPPKVKNLSGSDSIGQDADVVFTAKRYSKMSNIFLVGKNRHGGDEVLFHTNFKPNSGDFDEIPEDVAEDLRADYPPN